MPTTADNYFASNLGSGLRHLSLDPALDWTISQTVDCRALHDCVIDFNGANVMCQAFAGASKVAFDLTGAHRVRFNNLWLSTNAGVVLQVGIFMARSSANGPSAGEHCMDNVTIGDGLWSQSALLNYASEVLRVRGSSLRNSQPGGSAYRTSHVLTWPVTALGAYGSGSNLVHSFDDCGFGVYGFSDAESAIILGEATGKVSIRGGSLSAKTHPDYLSDGYTTAEGHGALAAIVCQGTETYPVSMVSIDGLQGDPYGPKQFVRVTGPVHGLCIANTQMPAREESLYVDASGRVLNLMAHTNEMQAGASSYAWGRSTGIQPLVTLLGETSGTLDMRGDTLYSKHGEPFPPVKLLRVANLTTDLTRLGTELRERRI